MFAVCIVKKKLDDDKCIWLTATVTRTADTKDLLNLFWKPIYFLLYSVKRHSILSELRAAYDIICIIIFNKCVC